MSTEQKPKPKPTNKRHHQIPQFYLRRFASPGTGEIWTYDKQTGDVRHSSVESTAHETHLYSLTSEDGSRHTAIEDLIAGIESKAAPLVEKILDGAQLVDQARADFASFLALMRVRTNSFRRQYAEMAGHILQSVMYAVATHPEAFEETIRNYEKEHGPLSAEEREACRQSGVDPSDLVLSIDREWTLGAMRAHDDLMPIFFRMHWTLVEVPDERYFITSDAPLVDFLPPRLRNALNCGGLVDPEVVVSLPLSPSLCWLGHWKSGAPTKRRVDSQLVSHFNALRARQAERFLYGPKHDGGIERLAKKYRGIRPTCRSHGFGPERKAEIAMHRTPRRGKGS